MNVKDIMTKDVKYCTPDTTLAEAAHLMWEADCAILRRERDDMSRSVMTPPVTRVAAA